jgi:DNA-binding XRE family transcriptional regulator
MNYPRDFPKQLQPPVDAALAEGEITFLELRKSPGYSSSREGALLLNYIKHVFVAFVHQACQAGREGTWTGERIRAAMHEFFQGLALQTYTQKHVGSMDSTSIGTFQYSAMRAMQNSEEWIEIQAALRDVAKLQETQPDENPKAELSHRPSLDYRLDQAIASLDITHEELARQIGIGKTTYFAVKRGGGKRSTQLKVEQHLRKLKESGQIRTKEN